MEKNEHGLRADHAAAVGAEGEGRAGAHRAGPAELGLHRGGREGPALPFDADPKAAPRAQACDRSLLPRGRQRRQQGNFSAVALEQNFRKGGSGGEVAGDE